MKRSNPFSSLQSKIFLCGKSLTLEKFFASLSLVVNSSRFNSYSHGSADFSVIFV